MPCLAFCFIFQLRVGRSVGQSVGWPILFPLCATKTLVRVFISVAALFTDLHLSVSLLFTIKATEARIVALAFMLIARVFFVVVASIHPHCENIVSITS